MYFVNQMICRGSIFFLPLQWESTPATKAFMRIAITTMGTIFCVSLTAGDISAPKIIYTFLESFDTSGKRLVTFCTSGSSGLGSSAENLKKLTPGATWLESRRFSIGTQKEPVEEWLDEIGLNP